MLRFFTTALLGLTYTPKSVHCLTDMSTMISGSRKDLRCDCWKNKKHFHFTVYFKLRIISEVNLRSEIIFRINRRGIAAWICNASDPHLIVNSPGLNFAFFASLLTPHIAAFSCTRRLFASHRALNPLHTTCSIISDGHGGAFSD